MCTYHNPSLCFVFYVTLYPFSYFLHNSSYGCWQVCLYTCIQLFRILLAKSFVASSAMVVLYSFNCMILIFKAFFCFQSYVKMLKWNVLDYRIKSKSCLEHKLLNNEKCTEPKTQEKIHTNTHALIYTLSPSPNNSNNENSFNSAVSHFGFSSLLACGGGCSNIRVPTKQI